MSAPDDALWAPLRTTDWSRLDQAAAVSAACLQRLAGDPLLLAALVGAAQRDPALRGMCESYDILDKVVLHDDPCGFRLRLHVFNEHYFDRPHNHRWAYTSRILRGQYRHSLFGTPPNRRFSLDDLSPALLRTERAGDCYTLDHRMVHSIDSQGRTVTLILRGPAVEEDFTVGDRVSGEVWVQRGAATESDSERSAKRMTDGRLATIVHNLYADGVLASAS